MKILSIDGGGMKGLLPALVLAAFENAIGQSISRHFDLIAGTSTGGILALGLAAGLPAMRLAEFYLERGPAIFSRSLKKRLASLGGMADELYDAGELEVALWEVFGDRMLSDVETRAMAVAYDIEMRDLALFTSWGGGFYRMADVARATSAAPTFFEPCRIKSLGGLERACIDGGVVANNPARLALVAGLALGAPLSAVRLVSLGTGRCEKPILLEAARSYGLAQWAPRLLDVMFAGQAELVDMDCRATLGEGYLRLQAELPEPVAMDATDAKSLGVLKLAAKQLAGSPEAVRALELAGAA
ncbi:patatin-like phospholipase family protein [Solidesulfovibrio magneticus]|uniref:Patatin family protein n=1 Tax=Solidesulfovibrio magneticus (strain ATCC 700980 / DSM 13731 / RS-1) TaxID=573370 RepID=C4XTK5_SOLM1|nr:patatin-like phospholipase family protein [Solidesulfovibrio magneticus]BAH76002.1 patatin family protein [Solidesulfovibrio magneticus RS-1]